MKTPQKTDELGKKLKSLELTKVQETKEREMFQINFKENFEDLFSQIKKQKGL